MGLFDPAYQKIIEKSPPGFNRVLHVFQPLIREDMERLELNAVQCDDFLALVLAQLAMKLSQETDLEFSSDARAYIERQHERTLTTLKPEIVRQANETASLVIQLLRSQFEG